MKRQRFTHEHIVRTLGSARLRTWDIRFRERTGSRACKEVPSSRAPGSLGVRAREEERLGPQGVREGRSEGSDDCDSRSYEKGNPRPGFFRD